MKAYIAIGSNLGNRQKNINRALSYLGKEDVNIRKTSSVYETLPEETNFPQPNYLNAVAEIESEISPVQLLEVLQKIESKLGRKRSFKNAPRAIDLDILFCDNQIIKHNSLTVPHPRLHKRYFVLRGLAEIIPDFVHPKLGKTVKSLYRAIA